MGKLSSFLALDTRDRRMTAQALPALAKAQLLVRLVPPRRWRARFGAMTAQSPAVPQAEQIETVRRVRFAMARAVRNLPTNPNCLPQALAARSMLQRRGIGSELFLGTQRDAAGVPRFHAWLKVGPEWVTGLCDESRYVLLLPGGSEPD